MLAVVAVVWLLGLATTLGWGAASLRWVLSAQTSTLVNSAIWFVGLPLGTVVVSLFVAHVVARWRGSGVLAIAMLVPSGLTLAVVAVAWRFAFAFRPAGRDQVGVVNAVVDAVGVEPVAWLTQQPLVNTVVLCTAGIWALTGLAVAVLLAAIRRIPPSLFESARQRGAGEWRLLVRVVVPAIRVPIVAVAAASACVAVATYDIVRVATGGNFDTQVLATESIDRSFVADQTGRGSALAVVMVVLVVAVMAALLVWRRRRGELAVVTPVPRHRAEGRTARHSRHDVEVTARSGRLGRWTWRALAVGLVVAWMVPVAGLVVTALRPAAEAEATGWWTLLSDPALTLDNVRRVLDDGMWAGVVDSLLVAVPVAAVAGALAVVVGRAEPEVRRATNSSWVLLAGAPVVALALPLYEVADAVGLEDSLLTTWVVHLVVLTPLAVLVAARAPVRWHGALAGALVAFLVAWNDQVVATVFLDGTDGITPATLRLAELVSQRGEEQHLVAAAALITAVVPLAVLLGARSLLLGVLVGRGQPMADEPRTEPSTDSGPDGVAGVDVEEVHAGGVDGEGGGLAEADGGPGLELGDAHRGAGRSDLVEGVGVAGVGGGGVDPEVDEDLRAE